MATNTEYGPFDYAQKVQIELSYSDLLDLKVALIDAKDYAQEKWSDYPGALAMIEGLQDRVRSATAEVYVVLPR
jgi:hypothetical protein